MSAQPVGNSDMLRKKLAYFFRHRHIRRWAEQRGPLPRDVYVPSHRDTRQLVRRIVERIRECEGGIRA